jgi:hypothetical protein
MISSLVIVALLQIRTNRCVYDRPLLSISYETQSSLNYTRKSSYNYCLAMPTNDHVLGEELQKQYEPHPDPQALTGNQDSSKNSASGVDYEPHPDYSVKISPEKEEIVRHICNLYSGSASEEDMLAYASEAVYDDPWSYCDTRYKIAGQWYGMSISQRYQPSP